VVEFEAKKERNAMKPNKHARVPAKPERRDDAVRNEPGKIGQNGFRFRTLEEHARQQPEIMKLQEILLSIGGEHLIAPPSATLDIPFLIEGGFVMDYPVTEVPMEPHRCHLNSAELFATGKATALCNGFALSEDGLWLQHSWALERQKDGTKRIIETTCKRGRYFGILYWGMLGKLVAMKEFEFNGVKPPSSLQMMAS